ncbi:MAG: acetyl-CoA carboxylase biotin carboxyl carrier protein [Phycisphaerales bacterium]|nr:acetyl-CoA carboxylase biotin carboxyl carrier protein [Phycisphaerales bacterium]
MIDIVKLTELVKLMVDNELSELDIRNGEEEVSLRRGGGSMGAPVYVPQPAMPQAAPQAPAAPAAPAAPVSNLIAIESPMVGTFYAQPNPETPSFVKPGSSISPDSIVCLIEAMKVFNEIKAEKSGVIEQVLVKNGEAVEFGQKLFLIRPA